MCAFRPGQEITAAVRARILRRVAKLQKSGHASPVSTVAKEYKIRPSAISRWRKKAVEKGGAGYLGSKRYPPDFRKQIVREYHELRKKRTRGAQFFLCNQYGLNMSTIRRWLDDPANR